MRGLRGAAISMIFQEPMTALNPLYTVGNQIAEVLELHEALRPNQARARAVELLARTGIAEPQRRVDAYPHQLSGGQRQRAMIAMALACRPKLLIADEPTTALDVTVQAQILALLDDLQREMGMAILFITHDLALVRRFTHRVGVMERGRLVEVGQTAEVFDRPRHPYTIRLVGSRPEREVGTADSAQPVVLAGDGIRVSFPVHGSGWFRRKSFDAVRGAALQLRRGETLGIVGESGSGKTTLGMALLALQPIAAGQISFEGGRIDNADRLRLRAMRRHMQVVFQDPFASLSPRMTIEQIVGEGLEVHEPALPAQERQARIVAVLAEVGLSESAGLANLLGRYPHEFSGGQRQRIGIARALAVEPSLIICDEPVSALDVSVQAQVLNLLADLQRQRGFAYLFIAHDLAVVRQVAQRIAVMYLGRIVETGPVDAVLAEPRHPYTIALRSAVPEPDPARHGGRIVLAGDPPSPAAPPPGCAFHPRCFHPSRNERCRTERPELRPVGAQLVACHFA